ncbi:unnamed protein product [Closterium sp. Yama58-4]|nr:unnamed protein product [Closterium sp. Yama58-4]
MRSIQQRQRHAPRARLPPLSWQEDYRRQAHGAKLSLQLIEKWERRLEGRRRVGGGGGGGMRTLRYAVGCCGSFDSALHSAASLHLTVAVSDHVSNRVLGSLESARTLQGKLVLSCCCVSFRFGFFVIDSLAILATIGNAFVIVRRTVASLKWPLFCTSAADGGELILALGGATEDMSKAHKVTCKGDFRRQGTKSLLQLCAEIFVGFHDMKIRQGTTQHGE